MSPGPHLRPCLKADEGKLRQVLFNLLGNAIKFTRHGTVELRLDVTEEAGGLFLVAEVEDTGAGIPADELPRVFQPFEQGAEGPEFEGGTGLGLTQATTWRR